MLIERSQAWSKTTFPIGSRSSGAAVVVVVWVFDGDGVQVFKALDLVWFFQLVRKVASRCILSVTQTTVRHLQ